MTSRPQKTINQSLAAGLLPAFRFCRGICNRCVEFFELKFEQPKPECEADGSHQHDHKAVVMRVLITIFEL
jgi:hypothetical protein